MYLVRDDSSEIIIIIKKTISINSLVSEPELCVVLGYFSVNTSYTHIRY